MMNKKNGLKTVLFASTILGLGVSFVSSVSFNIDLQAGGIMAINSEAITDNMMPIHFADNGSDFGGFLYFQDVSSIAGTTCIGDTCGEWISVQGNSIKYLCQQKIRGFYYNSERGERLWPLDDETWASAQPGLNTEGGLYTRCISEELADALTECLDNDDVAQCEANAMSMYGNLDGYYGGVYHTYNNLQNFGLVVGAQYSTDGSWISIDNSKPLTDNFIKYHNKYPLGFLYDYNGGLGFVGCEFVGNKSYGMKTLVNKLNSGENLEDLFYEDESDNTLIYSGGDSVGLNCSDVGLFENSLISIVIEGLVGIGNTSDMSIFGNQSNTKTQYFNESNNKLFDYAREKAETLCRLKWGQYIPGNTESLQCIDDTNGQIVDAQPGITYIVKVGDVKVDVLSNFDSDEYYDIFIDNGNLYLDSNDAVLSSHKKIFNKDGFISNGATADNLNTYKQNASSADYTGDDVAVGVFTKGNFIINGHVKPSEGEQISSRYFIYGKFTTKDSFADLEGVFTWRCLNGISTDSDEGFCPQSKRSGEWTNPYANAFLVVIDQNYPSKIFNG